MESQTAVKEGQEECLYCHGNGNTDRAGACPMCGDAMVSKTSARNPGPLPPRRIDPRLKALYEPLVAGV